jgi:ATP-dependent RNA helicase HelY
MDELAAAMSCEKGDFAEYAQLRRSLTEREGDLSRARASSRRAEAARSLAQLRPGDIIRVPGGRRAGLAVVLQPGLHPARGGNGNGRPADRAGRGSGGHDGPGEGRPGAARTVGNGQGQPEFTGPGPLVLTEGRQVKRLAVADFPVPAEVIDKIRIPGSFSPRSPQHRKDLAATMRNRLASQPAGTQARRRPVRAADWEQAAPEATGDIADLRRRLRRHPCHDCPDRENHARYAERYMRLARETEALERRVAGRSHVIARTFDRVCRVLERLGYLTGDTVTSDGQRLGRLYTELDLLAAECLRRGLWDDLSPAELAACVSALSFESRQADDVQPPRLPKGRVPEALAVTVRTWGELDQLEKDNDLSFLREPDLGFAWAAYRWARGARLESVLDETPHLTPGDFVRSVKQLIDLLDQIASVPSTPSPPLAPSIPLAATEPPADGDPRPADLAATARSAIDALRRGVIAYSAVTD